MASRKSNQGSFWHGFSTVLSLRPRSKPASRFVYRGKDLAHISAADAIRSDWHMVATDLSSSLEKARTANSDERSAVESAR